MKYFTVLITLLTLTACASPVMKMSDAEVKSLSDDQLCRYDNAYRSEARTTREIARRNLNCDPAFRTCLKRGNTPNTDAMKFCMDIIRENERLQRDKLYDDMRRDTDAIFRPNF
jgi:hypothetical protein